MCIWSFRGRSCLLPLWKARTSRDADDAVGSDLVVFSGSLRSPQEADALTVELGFQGGEITMHAADTELGRWPATAVDIRRFGKTAFEFTAEGDRLIFTPDDPATFGDRLVVLDQDDETDNRKRRRSKKRLEEDKPKLVVDDDLLEEQRTAGLEAGQEPAKRRARKRSRRHRTAAEEPAGFEPDRLDIGPVAPSAVPELRQTMAGDAHQSIDITSSDDRREPESPEDEHARSADLKERINATWIRAIDLARKYDTFGLDRVPIDTSLRGQEHEHTWDHRVAATSGLGQHICTICGAIRR